MFSRNNHTLSAQSEAVRLYLSEYNGIESTWNDTTNSYNAVNIAPWYNGREKGYIVSMRLLNSTQGQGKQINIAFYEHRSSDDLEAVIWEQLSLNPITVYNAKWVTEENYPHKFLRAKYGMCHTMAKMIYEELDSYYLKNTKKD